MLDIAKVNKIGAIVCQSKPPVRDNLPPATLVIPVPVVVTIALPPELTIVVVVVTPAIEPSGFVQSLAILAPA